MMKKGSVMMKDKEGNSYTADGEGNITISASKSINLVCWRKQK